MSDEWTDELVAAYANRDFAEALTIREEHLPSSVFKFRKVDGYSIKSLAEGTVWLSSPLDYNDPYDCAASVWYAHFLKAIPPSEVESLIKESAVGSVLSPTEIESALQADNPFVEIFRRLAAADPGLGIEDVEASLEQFMDLPSDGYGFLERALSRIREVTRVCSFSAATDHPMLMWSHYADNHRGFCMEYEVEHLPIFARANLHPVIYRAEMFDFTKHFSDVIADARAEGALESQWLGSFLNPLRALYKAPDWAYEKEWRLVFLDGDIRFNICRIGRPNRVYLGARISETDGNILLDICDRYEIDAYHMRLMPNRFELTTEPILLKEAPPPATSRKNHRKARKRADRKARRRAPLTAS